MTLVDLIVLLVVAGVAGAIGQTLAGYSGGGCLFSIAIGFLGAYIGTWLARQFGFPPVFTVSFNGETFPLFWAIIGAALLVLIVGTIGRGRRRRFI